MPLPQEMHRAGQPQALRQGPHLVHPAAAPDDEGLDGMARHQGHHGLEQFFMALAPVVQAAHQADHRHTFGQPQFPAHRFPGRAASMAATSTPLATTLTLAGFNPP